MALGALLGGLVFQIYCKNQYETAIFKIVSCRYHGSLGWLLDAMLAHFGEVLDPKMEPEKKLKTDPKNGPKNDNLLDHFWAQF